MKFIFPFLLLLISGLLFFFVANPMYSDVTKLRADVDAYNIALSNSTNLQKTRDDLLSRYKNITQEDKDRLDRFLPNTVNNIKFILEIERLASLHNMPLNNIKFEPPQQQTAAQNGTPVTANDPSAAKPYGVFPIEFTTQGNYDTFVQFIKDVEHNLRLVDVKSVAFNVPAQPVKPTDGDPNIYTYTLKVETYWLK